jgi:hypothetical protein
LTNGEHYNTALLARARGAANGAAFERLWRGETGDHGGDASAADLALCAHLRFWTGGDRARMDRLFRRSGRMRPKWDERRGDRTYAERTLDRALAGGGDGYASVRGTLVAPGATKVPPPPDGEAFSAFSSSSGESPAARPGPSDAELAEAIGEAPELPPDAALPADLAEEGAVARAVWLDPYIAAARALSPRTPRTLHEAAGLFALATALARRAYVRVGSTRLYPAFFLAFVERSTLYSKTGGLDVLRLLLDAAGLRDLLLPASFTPQALVADLALHVPQAVREAGAAEQARWLERHRHGAQRAVVRDELAGLFEDCTREHNAGLLPLLLKLDGAPGAVDPDLTLTRGLVEVRDVAINLIGATTPAAFRQHAAKPYHWANGLFGRFALLAAGEPPAYAFWPEHVTTLPAAVVDGLKRIYGAFPRPRAAFVYADPAEGARPDGKAGRERPGLAEQRAGPPIVGAAQEGYGAVAFAVEPEAWRAWRRYDAALFGLVQRGATPERLDPTYGRLPTAAIRLALTLAAAEWALDGGPASGLAPLVERRHWAAAQEVAERWRRHAHAVLARALREEAADDAATAAARLVRFLATAGGRLKRGDLQRGLHLSSADLDAALAAAGPRVRTWETDTGGKPARWVALAVGDSAEAAGAAASPATDAGAFPARATKATKALHQRRDAGALVARAATKAPASGVLGSSDPFDPAAQIGRGDAGGTAPDGQHGQEVEP